jgi:hypothetical protein
MSQEVIPRQKVKEVCEEEVEFVTPPQSPEHLAERASISAIKRTPLEIQHNKEQVLSRRASKLSLPEERELAIGGSEQFSLPERTLAGRTSRQALPMTGGERNLLSWFEQASASTVNRSPDPRQCLAVYKQVTSDFTGLAGVPKGGFGRTPVLASTYIPASADGPGITIHHQTRREHTIPGKLCTPEEKGSTSKVAVPGRSSDTLDLVHLQLIQCSEVRVSVVNIQIPIPATLGRIGCPQGKRELLNLLVTPLYYRIYELRRRFPKEECRPASWPRQCHQAPLDRFRIYKNDIHIWPGEAHPIDPAHIFKFGLTMHRHFAILDIVLTLRPEQEALLLTAWQKTDTQWEARRIALFVYTTYSLIDLEINSHPSVKSLIARESRQGW